MKIFRTKPKIVNHRFDLARRFMRSKTAVVGLVIFVFILLVALFADLIVPYSKSIKQNSNHLREAPSKEFWFGTDALGRDIFARVIHGSRISIAIGVITSVTAIIFGAIFGSIAAYYGGKIDNVIMRIVDIIMCIPSILLSLTIVATLGASFFNLIIAMLVTSVFGTIRFVRGVILTITEQDFIEAARAYGARPARIILKYILPNAFGPIMVDTTMTIASIILSASGLSYLGMGIQPPAPEWGAMLSDAKEYLRIAPHMMFFPGIAIILTAFSINLMGDGLRDTLDPKLRD
jgi:peptide/nickel transport system permease protein